MSIPLDKLYHYLQDIINEDIIIYRWFPHGSRNLENLKPWSDYSNYEFLVSKILGSVAFAIN